MFEYFLLKISWQSLGPKLSTENIDLSIHLFIHFNRKGANNDLHMGSSDFYPVISPYIPDYYFIWQSNFAPFYMWFWGEGLEEFAIILTFWFNTFLGFSIFFFSKYIIIKSLNPKRFIWLLKLNNLKIQSRIFWPAQWIVCGCVSVCLCVHVFTLLFAALLEFAVLLAVL